jgi:ferredoxin-NADP reductase/MOSC domain-containing protein YiiM/ferredoxin
MTALVALCVGQPKDVAWHGSTVHTGIWKQPVAGPVMARRLNLDGDGQGDLGGHGGEQRAVLVYQLSSYRYWQEVLGRDDFVHGQFGENFTVEGLADDEVCIGDRYQVGDAVFEVTQPRVTCYRVGIRMSEPRMAALLVSHHRPGFYMRVLTEGYVQAGDEIVKLSSGPEAMTVAEVDALLYLPGHPGQQIRRALRIPALSPGWQASFRDMLEDDRTGVGGGNVGLNTAAAAPAPAWSGFRVMRVTRRVEETPSVTSVWLAATDGATLPDALPGQFVTLRLSLEVNGPAVLRTYSLSNPGGTEYRVSVKRERGGTASIYIHDHLLAGTSLEVAAPRGTFTLHDGDNPVVFLSAGIGVTPILAMLYALAAQRSNREVWWLYGCHSAADHAFAAEVHELLSRLGRARSHICYSQPGPQDGVGDGELSRGRLSVELIAELGVPRDADVYVCGPQAFMAELGAGLVGLGFAPSRIRTETFGALSPITPGIAAMSTKAPHLPPGRRGRGPAVAFARSGLSANWDDDFASLLELAEACDVPVRWACRTGVCHTCETAMLSGSVTYDPEPVDTPALDDVLVCCSRPETDIALDL